MPIRIELDPSVCTGHGRCYVLASEVFAADEAGNGTVLRSVVDGPMECTAASTAAQNCPEGAIRLIEQT